jgi:4-diphosphocytidyl-2-C-methyl-D-erythritol kinase
MLSACQLLLLLTGLIRFYSVSGFVGFQQHHALFTDKRILRSSIRSSATDTNDSSSTESTKETLSLFSPCKINLFLRIIRKREDGFHDLASLFQAIGFGDTLEMTPLDESADKDEFSCNMAGVPVDSSNLVVRAMELMRQQTGTRQYFKANLIKQVPAQAGLGGGSANAAAAMWGANELMGRPASLDEVRAFLWTHEINGTYEAASSTIIGFCF